MWQLAQAAIRADYGRVVAKMEAERPWASV